MLRCRAGRLSCWQTPPRHSLHYPCGTFRDLLDSDHRFNAYRRWRAGEYKATATGHDYLIAPADPGEAQEDTETDTDEQGDPDSHEPICPPNVPEPDGFAWEERLHAAQGLIAHARRCLLNGSHIGTAITEDDWLVNAFQGEVYAISHPDGTHRTCLDFDEADRRAVTCGAAVGEVRGANPADFPTLPDLTGDDHLVVGAVDNHLARRELARAKCVWLDCGNHHNAGQVLVGNTGDPDQVLKELRKPREGGRCRYLPPMTSPPYSRRPMNLLARQSQHRRSIPAWTDQDRPTSLTQEPLPATRWLCLVIGMGENAETRQKILGTVCPAQAVRR
ncbi:MAG: hypothetical protein JW910_15725 [Anaerolineae bacterium]|nr:hypothetical protein [Anaerolineae bacterium]